MTYDERVRAIAEEMAENSLGKCWPNAAQKQKEWHIKHNMEKADIAVKHMADAVIAWVYGSVDKYERVKGMGKEGGSEYFRNYLFENGLIPSAQEGGSDGKE